MKNSIPPREARAFSNINNHDSMRAMLLSFMISFFFLLHSLIVDCFFFLRSKKYQQMQKTHSTLRRGSQILFCRAQQNVLYSKNKTNKQTNKQTSRANHQQKATVHTKLTEQLTLHGVLCIVFIELNAIKSSRQPKQNKTSSL
jgi:hypothetical protein